jgi:N6-adenosine-specific RNA methylase IME4
MQLVKWSKARFESNSLIIDNSVTQTEWKQLGQGLGQIEGCVQFWIGDWARFGDKKGFTGKYTDPKVYDELEEITGLDRKTIKNYKSVAEKTSSYRCDDLSFTHHMEVAKLEPKKQEIFLKKASEENLSVRDLRQAIRIQENTEGSANLPTDKKYRVIYADPPWSYGNQMPRGTTTPNNYYNTMTLQEICDLPVKDIAEKDSILFLWTTSPHLRESFEVVDSWGFEYKTSFVWDKVKHNMGHYNSVRHEFLLVCTRGSCTPDNIKLFDSVYSEERTEHSQKPEHFREIIDTLYTWGDKIELFARKKAEGWEVFGNEA